MILGRVQFVGARVRHDVPLHAIRNGLRFLAYCRVWRSW